MEVKGGCRKGNGMKRVLKVPKVLSVKKRNLSVLSTFPNVVYLSLKGLNMNNLRCNRREKQAC